jgi:hypothetical protein
MCTTNKSEALPTQNPVKQFLKYFYRGEQLQNIYKKLGVNSRSAAITAVIQSL